MKIGIVSETHGHIQRTQAAISQLKSSVVNVIIHCGDIGSEMVLAKFYREFTPLNIPFYAVLGNVDFPDDEYVSWSEAKKFEVLGRFGELSLNGKNVAVIHGDDSRKLDSAITSKQFDYVLTGHTHIAKDQTIEGTRVINPGAVYRSNQPSIAVLDLVSDRLEFLPI